MKKWLIVAISATLIASVVFWIHIDRQNAVLLEDSVVAFKSGDYENAVPVLKVFADDGEPAAIRLTALAYAFGLGVDANDESAHRYILLLSDDERGSLCQEDIGAFAASESGLLRDVCMRLGESEP